MLQDSFFYVILLSIGIGVFYIASKAGKPLGPSVVIMSVYIIISITALLAIKYKIKNPFVSYFLKRIRDAYNRDRVERISSSIEEIQARSIKAIEHSGELKKEADALLAMAKTSLKNVERLETLLDGAEGFKTAEQIHKEAVESATKGDPDKLSEAISLLSELKKRNQARD